MADDPAVDMMLVEREVNDSAVCVNIGVSDFWFMPVHALVVSPSSDTSEVLVVQSEVLNSAVD